MRKILLVNDDGYNAEGIKKIKEEIKDYGEIYVVAPKNHMSAKGTSITISNFKMQFEKIDEHNYAVNGTPADCVSFAFDNLNVKFDLVISGCNYGLNHSIFSIWSGTIGACIQAGVLGIPSIAFSCSMQHMEHIHLYTKKTLDYILSHNIVSKDHIISVNFPYTEKALGIRFTDMSFNDRNLVFLNDGLIYENYDMDIDFKDKSSDLYCLSHGYISITPLSLTIFDKEIYKSIKPKCEDVNF